MRDWLRGNQTIVSNFFWLLASLVLAFWVWFIATTANDPFVTKELRPIPVQLELDDDVVATSGYTRSATVTVLAQDSEINLITQDDIVVRADLRGLGPGTHTIPLQANVAPNRRARAETQPTQITVTLEQVEAQQKPVRIAVSHNPPIGFAYTEPLPDIRQAEVTGAASIVSNVVEVVGSVDLTDKRNPVQVDLTLIPVDSDGDAVEGVSVEPKTTLVSVDVFQRDDIEQVSISPRIQVETLPEGYMLSTLSYEPQTIFVSGSASELEEIEGIFFTELIDLTERTDDFVVDVAIELPYDDLVILDGQNTVTVTVGIEAQTSVEQIDNLPIGMIGLGAGLNADIAPGTISVVLNGPVVILDNIDAEDVQVVVDLAGLGPGNHSIVPVVTLREGQDAIDNVTLLPTTVDVIIVADVDAEATDEPDTP